ncbi:MAG: hypothetical protein AAB685_01685, partial [Patescibacteria group bacterium]
DFYHTNTSLGILRYLVSSSEEQKTYCGDCIGPVIEDYLDLHPYARKEAALEIARERLDNLGYGDVEVVEDQTWRYGPSGWRMFTQIEYERDGRRIVRYTGMSSVDGEGEFAANMLPQEYVDFRYQT